MAPSANEPRRPVAHAPLCLLAILEACTWGIYDGRYTGGGGGNDAGSSVGNDPIVIMSNQFGGDGTGNGTLVSQIVTDGTNLYGEEPSTSILSIPLMGGMVTTLVTANINGPLTTDGTYVYFEVTGNNPGVMRIRGSGGPIGMVGGLSNVVGTNGVFATDGTNIYFTNRASIPNDASRYLVEMRSLAVGGGTPTTLGSIAEPNDSSSAAIATDGRNVYWLDSYTPRGILPGLTTGYSLNSVPETGGSVTTLANPMGSPNEFVTDGKNIYWLDYVPYWDGSPTSASVTPGGVTTVYAVPVAGGSVRVVSSSTSSVAPVFVVAQCQANCDTSSAESIATDGVDVYWVTDEISRAPVGGGAASTFVSALELQALKINGGGRYLPRQIALDSGNVYWLLKFALMKRAKR